MDGEEIDGAELSHKQEILNKKEGRKEGRGREEPLIRENEEPFPAIKFGSCRAKKGDGDGDAWRRKPAAAGSTAAAAKTNSVLQERGPCHPFSYCR